MSRRVGVTDGRRFNGRTPRGLSVEARFWAKVDKNGPGGCWLWTASLIPRTGYGAFTPRSRTGISAHRWAYINTVGAIPEGLVLDHLCRVRRCVNPDHLEPVTPLENTRRGVGNGKETHCPHGHPYSGPNLYVHAGHRSCRACRRVYLRAWHAITPDERAARKAAGLPVVDLAAIFATHELTERRAA